MLKRLFVAPPDKETRVNLKHLLEDIRDSYPLPLNETIIVELIANALDAQPTGISFMTDSRNRAITIIDDGKGMTREELEQYHDIAATTKVRGEGIGFAGVGAKLSLLMGKVTTETRTSQSHDASEWWLETALRAPWRPVFPKGRVQSLTGTAITVNLKDSSSCLLRSDYIEDVVRKHFYPLLDEKFGNILGMIYPQKIHFRVDGMSVAAKPLPEGQCEYFSVYRGRRQKPIGVGFIVKCVEELDEELRGVAISTYGKVIKRGWDWLGILPKNPAYITGIVEIPALSEILIINKADFLKDATSLQKYYACRKAVQEALEPILRKLGEIVVSREKQQANLHPLEKEIQKVLQNMLNDFPELNPLLGRRGRINEKAVGILPDNNAEPIGQLEEGGTAITGTFGGAGQGSGVEALPDGGIGQRIGQSENVKERGKQYEGYKKRASLMVSYEDSGLDNIGRLFENTVFINRTHPAFQKAAQGAARNFYEHITVSWVLSRHLEEGKSPLDFINRYLLLWGKGV
ncbi:MAG: ATP-binding protein [Chloroflexi bacterium]|nr:ATP-binding protein [Chloroflexota bacterium]